MKVRTGTVWKLAGIAAAVVVAAGIVVPYINTGSYGERLRSSLERALGRRVEFRGRVRFSLFSGPGFSVDDVVIHEDPSIGLEPIAYMDTMTVRPSLWSLAGGRFVIAPSSWMARASTWPSPARPRSGAAGISRRSSIAR